MKPRPILVTCACLFTLLCARGAEPLVADSFITRVTVYVDRAVVVRTATVELLPGGREVVFTALPDSLDPSLLQVSGSGSATASILDVRAASAQREATANPRLALLQEQARSLQTELRGLNDRSTVLEQQRDYLEKIKAASVTPPTADGVSLPKLPEWQHMLDFYTQSLGRALNEQQDLDRQREDVQARLTAVEREIDGLQASALRAVKNVFVRINVAEAGEMILTLAYTVANASWSPAYDVRVASAEKKIDLGYAAMVRQSTGEDWKGVQLVLSTARPALGGSPPELFPWYLHEERPLPAAAPAEGVALSAFEAMADRAKAAGEVPARRELETLSAAVESGLTAANFTLAYAADVPADNAPHKVSIANHPLEGELFHLSVPKLAEFAYLQATVKNTSDFPLMAGPVNLYLDGTYVARSEIETVMPGERFDLSLGVDSSIQVERKLINRLQENTGIISRHQRITYDWLITITNKSQSAQTITVQDQLPIAQHEKIIVKLLAPATGAVQKDEDGLLTWKVSLLPDEKRELPLKISVECPSDFPIGGLD